MLAIRMTRHGTKKRPFFHIVVADSRSPRDGRFIEKLGTYNPMLDKGHPERVKMKAERVTHWLSVGALPSERVQRFLGEAGLAPVPAQHQRPKKSTPRTKAQERLKAAEAASAAGAPAVAAPSA